MSRSFFMTLMIAAWGTCSAQQQLPDFIGFIDQVRGNHPQVRIGSLLVSQAEKGISKARGGFDPKLDADMSGKFFSGKQYYEYNDMSLKMPTVLGMELYGGYELNRGEYLNKESSTPENGLFYSGLALNVGKGLFIDERRKDLGLAKNQLLQSQNMYNDLLNDLIFNASQAYWDYYFRFQQRRIAGEYSQNAQVRFLGVRDAYLNGDLPAIDTVEAYLQWQTRKISLQEAEIYLQNAFFGLTNYLWNDSGANAEELCCPDIPNQDLGNLIEGLSDYDISALKENINIAHPDLMAYDQKAAALEIERRWYKEALKPEIKLKYQLLTDGANDPVHFSFNNYRWGMGLQMPLLLRKERANVHIANLKIQTNEISRQLKLIQLNNKFDGYLAEFQLLTGQLETIEKNKALAERLLEAEKTKFSAGESSVFLINSRENQVIAYELKLQEIRAKAFLKYYSLLWSSGQLPAVL